MISPPKLLTTSPITTAVIRLTIPCVDMGRHMDPAIQEIIATVQAQGLAIVGPLYAYHHRRPTDTFDFELGFPVDGDVRPAGRVVPGVLPKATVVRSVYQGPYDHLPDAWRTLERWVNEHGHGHNGRFWECYLNNPDELTDPQQTRTELNWVVQQL